MAALLRILREEGVDRVFGNPGTTELPLIDALAEAPDLPYTLAVQELSAVAMADGYARATGRPAFVNLHVAAGLANGLIGLLNARRSRTPLVVTAGQQDRRHYLQDPMLSGDLVGIAAPAVKATFDVQHGYDLPIALRRAFALATTAPQGPVFLSIPMDLLDEQASVAFLGRSEIQPPGPATGIEAAAELLAGAASPVIVAGDGVGRAGAVTELVEVAEAIGAVVYHQPMNDGINFPGNHPLFAGMLAPNNEAIRNALAGHDALFVAGTHAFMPHHYTPGPAVPDGLPTVQLDEDATELGRNFPVQAGLVGALGPSLAALADALAGRVPEAALRRAVIARRTAAARAEIDDAAQAAYGEAPLDPLAAAHAVATGLPADTLVVEEAITAGLHLRRTLRQNRPKSYVHTIGGGLGWGIGAAVGSKLGSPDRPVAAVLGDGSAMFGLQGLWSAARYRVPVAFVVMNNGEYRTLKETLDRDKRRAAELRNYPGLDLTPPPLNWTRAGEFFGVRAVRVTSTEELREVVALAGDLDAPLLIDVPIRSHSVEFGY